MLSLTSFEVSAQSTNMWQLNLNSDGESSTVQTENSKVSLSRLNQQNAVNPLAEQDITKLSWQSNLSSGLQAVNLNYSDGEYSAALGYREKGVTVSAMAGSGKQYARIADGYAGLDPYLFHGGNGLSYDFVGAALDVAVSKHSHIQFGYADVGSKLLEARRTQYIEWATNRYFVRGSYFQRGQQGLGYGLDAGFYVGGMQVAYQALELDDDKSMHRVRFHYKQNNDKQYWVDLSNQSNALFEAKDDYRVMFSMRLKLGGNKASSNYSSSGERKDSYDSAWGSSSNRLYRSNVVDSTAAAGAVAASSGNEGQDRSKRALDQHGAAHNRLDQVNPVSVSENREYGGYVYQNQDGSFASTDAIAGQFDSITLPHPKSVIPHGTRGTASYHTHSAPNPNYNAETFSDADIHADQVQNINGYLGTPHGALMYHEVATGNVSRIGSVQH